MTARTWPYGTRKQIKIESIKPKFIVCLEESSGEGFILAGISGVTSKKVKEGETATIEFKKGGPMGGYWDII